MVPEPFSSEGALLSASALSYSYGENMALADVTLHARPGETVAVMGPSGSGKTTLLQCLAGVIVPDSGTVTLAGRPLSQATDGERGRLRRTLLGFVLPSEQLLTELSVEDNVALPLQVDGSVDAHALEKARELLASMGLSRVTTSRPSELSTEQARRVAIARAVITWPIVVFADEPTLGLDATASNQVMDILTDTARRPESTLIVATTDPQVAMWADRIVRLEEGHVVSIQSRSLVTVR